MTPKAWPNPVGAKAMWALLCPLLPFCPAAMVGILKEDGILPISVQKLEEGPPLVFAA
jgi:hypothetical protein